MKKLLLIIFLIGLIFTFVLDYFYIYPFDKYIKKYYEKQFLAVPNVSFLKDHSHYEGTRAITLVLEDNKQIEIWGFDLFVFTKTDWIGLGTNKGLAAGLECKKNINGNSIGINAISFINALPLKIEIKNIDDLIKNYNIIYNYFLTFPKIPEQAKIIRMDNLVDKNKDHWCHISNRRETNGVKSKKWGVRPSKIEDNRGQSTIKLENE